VIRVDEAWLAVQPLDMRAGVDTALGRVVSVFGAARAHHAYIFTNKRSNRLKVLLHDGWGLWLCARRLHEGRFIRASSMRDASVALTREQLQALVVGLPWERIGDHATIRVL
jgi:transposase